MPGWLKTMLVALGLLILVALVTEPVLAALRRRQKTALQAGPATAASPAGRCGPARPGSCARPRLRRARPASCWPTMTGSS